MTPAAVTPRGGILHDRRSPKPRRGAGPAVSVIVLTRDRPQEFRAVLYALALQRYRHFEVIVVGAEETAEKHGAAPEAARRVTYAQCVEQNISLSRNIGISLASGDIIAFIDDDAAPEPDWLDRLVVPFERQGVGAVGGFVRGRNGIDFQWRGALVDRYGGHFPISVEDLLRPDLGADDGEFFVSTVGVNGAFRRAALEAIGGFDENLHYFLDESDVCIRLHKAGWSIVFAPDAEVHHAYAESSERKANRAPRDLFQIAASRAYFSRVYGHPDWQEVKVAQFREEQAARMAKFVQLGRISRRQAAAILARLEDGLAEGARRFVGGTRYSLPRAPAPHIRAELPFRDPSAPRRTRVALVVGGLARSAIYRAAAVLAGQGYEVSLIDFQLRAKRLRVWFEDGIWHHVGGVLGRDRFDAPLPMPRRCLRVARELERIGARRDFDVIVRPTSRKFQVGDLRPTPLGGRLVGFVAEPLHTGAAQPVVAALIKAI